MRPALGIHGIGVTAPYGVRWAKALARRGVHVRMREGPWRSRGSIPGDLVGLLLDPVRRRNAVTDVAESIHWFFVEHPDGILVSHSAGQAIAFAALRWLAERGIVYDVPHVSMGGPCFHLAFGPVLRTVGLGGPPPGRKPIHLWNPEDSVCVLQTFGRFGIKHPTWVDARYTPVEGRNGLVGEHDATDYLDTYEAQRAFTSA